MAGANLHDNDIEGAFELWVERNIRVDTNGASTVIKESSIRINISCCDKVQDILNLGGTTDVY